MIFKYILDNLICIYVLGMMDVKVKPKDTLFEVNYFYLSFLLVNLTFYDTG